MKTLWLLLVLATPLRAQVGRILSDGLIVADCATTHLALRRPGTVESNPVLGFHPTDTRLAIWCGAALTANHVGVNWLFGKKDGQVVWFTVALVELLATRHNAVTLGWRVRL